MNVVIFTLLRRPNATPGTITGSGRIRGPWDGDNGEQAPEHSQAKMAPGWRNRETDL